LRHRGHRFISVRRYGPAARDLARADELRPRDFDICYHLGLARWLLGDYAGARRAYESCLPHCADDESRVALTYWLALAAWRLGDTAAVERLLADVGSPAVSENRHYLDVLSLIRGERREADIRELARENALAAGTLGFGLGLWHYLSGRLEQAAQDYVEVVAGSYWPAFGFIAAETELARLQGMLPA
jgi:tetratricopeptide (TPR) repeat protein